MRAALAETYYYISGELIALAVKKGISKALEEKLRKILSTTIKICYCDAEIKGYDRTLKEEEWTNEILNPASDAEKAILNEFFKPRKALKVLFSGEKEWIEPSLTSAINIEPSPLPGDKKFLLKIHSDIEAGQPAVTFYDKEKLKEDFNTTLPLVKIELDDKIKLRLSDKDLEEKAGNQKEDICFLLRDSFFCINEAFIDEIEAVISTDAKDYLNKLLTPQNDFQIKVPMIDVECFLDVIDEDTNQPVFTGQDKLVIMGLANDPLKNYCRPVEQSVSLYHFFRNVTIINEIGSEKTRIEVKICGLKNLIVQNDESVQNVNAPIYPFGTRPRVGASFYIGSKELFSKDWREVYVNTEWKDKPKDFGVHYKHYDYKDTTFEDGTKQIVNSSFLTTASVLDKGIWKADGQRRLFKTIAGEQPRTEPPFPPVPPKVETPASFCNY